MTSGPVARVEGRGDRPGGQGVAAERSGMAAGQSGVAAGPSSSTMIRMLSGRDQLKLHITARPEAASRLRLSTSHTGRLCVVSSPSVQLRQHVDRDPLLGHARQQPHDLGRGLGVEGGHRLVGQQLRVRFRPGR
ncbi:hypothetical protein ACWEWX_32110, partial [Streptomyces asiaticus]